MALQITSLNSGSNGNCYYIGNDKDAVLIDVGISCREIEKRLHRLGLSMQKIKAVFISHEHSDHIRGLTILSKKYSLPIYITQPTLDGSKLVLNENLIYSFECSATIQISSLIITPFSKHHDAADPYSFMISDGEVNIGVFTDLGKPCTKLTYYFQQCHAAFLEANYDEEMLENGNYPFHLKQRIRGGKGHLSNAQALNVFTQSRPPFMTHLLLSHLSEHNNCPDLVASMFTKQANGVEIVVASRYMETPLLEISAIPQANLKPTFGMQMELHFDTYL